MDRTQSYTRSQRHLPAKFARFEKNFTPGTAVPDLATIDIDGRPVRLADLWEEKPLILEFGSAT